jgi:hypothetical protein
LDGSAGPTFSGITTISATGYMKVPVGNTKRRTYIPPTDNIVTNGLVLNLDAGREESFSGAGLTWTDLSGYGNNGTLVGGVGFTDDNGGSLVFDGVNDAIALSNITPTSGASFSAWIYINGSNSNYGAIFANWSNVGGGQAYFIGTNEGASSTIQIYFSGALIYNITSLPLNTWMLLTITHNGSTSIGYINGIQIGSGASSLSTSTNNTSIGYDITRTNYPFKGNIAQASIYNRALSAAEVLQNYNALKDRYV